MSQKKAVKAGRRAAVKWGSPKECENAAVDACLKKDLGTLIDCLDAGANLNTRSSDQATLAVICAHFGWEEGLLELISRGVDLSVADSSGDIPLRHAIVKGHKSCAWQCLDHMGKFSSDVIVSGHKNLLPILSLHSSKEERVRLLCLLSKKNVEALELYVELLLRSAAGHDAVKGFCRAAGVDKASAAICRGKVIEAGGWNAKASEDWSKWSFTQADKAKGVGAMVKHGKSMSVEMFSSLGSLEDAVLKNHAHELFFGALDRSDLGVIKHMGSKGFDVNSVWDEQGRVALSVAIRKGDANSVQALLDLGALGAKSGLKLAIKSKRSQCASILRSFLEREELMQSVSPADGGPIKVGKGARVRL